MSLVIIPAIDIRGGRCVRLLQGDYAKETRYSDDPVAVAMRWKELGGEIIHVVDLDGAKGGVPVNHELLARICAGVRVPVEVSGGMRTMADIFAAFAYGAGRVQIGSAAVSNPALVREACAAFPGRIVVSIDAKNGEVMTDGWIQGSGVDATALANQMVDLGVPRIMYTDITSDGMLGGPNLGALAALARALPVPVVASGGVSNLDHVRAVAATRCEALIIGKALYEGTLTLPEAISAASSELRTQNSELHRPC